MNAMQLTRFWIVFGMVAACFLVAPSGAVAQQTPTQPGSQGPSLSSDEGTRDSSQRSSNQSSQSRRGLSGNEVTYCFW